MRPFKRETWSWKPFQDHFRNSPAFKRLSKRKVGVGVRTTTKGNAPATRGNWRAFVCRGSRSAVPFRFVVVRRRFVLSRRPPAQVKLSLFAVVITALLRWSCCYLQWLRLCWGEVVAIYSGYGSAEVRTRTPNSYQPLAGPVWGREIVGVMFLGDLLKVGKL